LAEGQSATRDDDDDDDDDNMNKIRSYEKVGGRYGFKNI